ncbi:SDR family oxidoreductase [Agrobacterium rubi]|uniref:SDR family oxidoreductase n=1 Tax=Agrobacterium rubi TaxID=28099 RepID=A0AAE7UN99_9HYPH|nr:SDR family oxidoreductase [Agrobacterium rubi]NTE86760.1 SDR family oxidoreductase [Agrobacterium rubi]NTF02694.1 SDR family oxidoreductase [Agrobacterium rubi]NTF36938.1 SDR family oxidoreductase [Agrobacterium rubi]QTF99378.1 SDR family oxidoreductase [Agrobacterium rubi]
MMSKILVTGASGQLGQAVIHHLLKTYGVAASDIVAASRDTAKLSALAAKGVETRKADFDDPTSLDAAFAGIDTLLIVSTDALAVPGQRLTQHKAAVAAAAKAGVKHLAYTSMPNPDKSLVTFAPDHLGTEEAVKASGVPYTIIRNAWYYDNYMHAMPHNLQSGKWFTATGNGKVSNISRDDCARAAAAVLAKSAPSNTTYTLTGPESLTADEIAKIISDAAGKPLVAVQVTGDQLKQGIESAGLPGFVADMLVSADANVAAGNFDILSSDYETLTGEKPQSTSAFFKAHKAALAG